MDVSKREMSGLEAALVVRGWTIDGNGVMHPPSK